MKYLLFLTALALVSCVASPPSHHVQAPHQQIPTQAQLSRADYQKIGRKIWQNESGGKVSGLTAWNPGEGFPSLGIGHFIWYPAGQREPFTESFPAFIRFAQSQHVAVPAWLRAVPPCPWRTRAQFYASINGPRLTELRRFLANNIELQTAFIVQKSRTSLPKMLAAAPASQRATIQANYHKVAASARGMYALIDYVNFKGEGINPSERYLGQGWGLMQVLAHMRPCAPGVPAAVEFSRSAQRTLNRRISNSPPARGEARWRAGWMNRCATYARPL